MAETTTSPRSGRLNMRVAPEQEELLRAAAEASGQSMTGFVLGASVDRAHEVLAAAHRIEVSAQTFREFVAALDLDDTGDQMPVLSRYATE